MIEILTNVQYTYGGLQKIKLDTNMIGFLLDKMEVHDE